MGEIAFLAFRLLIFLELQLYSLPILHLYTSTLERSQLGLHIRTAKGTQTGYSILAKPPCSVTQPAAVKYLRCSLGRLDFKCYTVV